VTPIILNNEVKAVIDIDAPIYNRFNENDQKLLEEFASVLAPLFK
jgi:putative methionine-R-sulfoxide reductase with GAF domain